MKKIIEQQLAICLDCQNAIIAGTLQNDPVLCEHLKNCGECQSFAAFYSQMLAVEPAMPDVELPEFSDLNAKARRKRESSSRFLRMVIMPLSAAAAFMLAICGIFFYNMLPDGEKNGTVANLSVTDNVTADTSTTGVTTVIAVRDRSAEKTGPVLTYEEISVAALTENVTMAWDVATHQEAQCRTSMNAARSNEDWSIDYFNPYSEE